MGPAFVLLFWLIIGAVFAGIWGVALVVMIVAALKRWRVVKYLSGAVVVSIPILALLIGAFIAFGIIRSSIPRYVFTDVFDCAPNASISNIQSDVFWFADTGSVYLRFNTDVETFRRLVPATLSRTTAAQHAKERCRGETPPQWWLSEFSSTAEIYSCTTPGHGDGKAFAWESTVMAYVPEQGCAYYHFVGID